MLQTILAKPGKSGDAKSKGLNAETRRMAAWPPEEVIAMDKRFCIANKKIAGVLCAAALLLYCIASPGAAAYPINTKGNVQEERIESTEIPQAAPVAIADLKEKFDNGGNVSTLAIDAGSVTINTNLSGQGIIGVGTNVAGDKRLKVKISKDEAAEYYDIASNDMIKIPMQFGNGTYLVELYQNIQDAEYVQVFANSVEIEMADENNVFLCSSQMVNYENSTASPGLAAALTKNLTSDADKLKAVYEYVIGNISYDSNKINTLTSSYIPNVDDILLSKDGICYDFAAVLASLLREAAIPAKLVMGYRSDTPVYHAWNEVLVDGSWITVDATWDSVLKANGQSYDMVKDAAVYSAEKVF